MLRLGTQLYQFCHPLVMGILNVTPDSFAVHCESLTPESVLSACSELIAAGADIIDIGACSTRPGAVLVSEQDEWQRLDMSLSVIRKTYPHIIISLDTFRASLAQRAIQQYAVDIINDVSGMADPDMLNVISLARVPYILTYSTSDCSMLEFFARKLDQLHRAHVADVIIDPGLGFAKTCEQNYAILHQIALLHCLNVPVMVGLSRKSMLCQPLSITPQQALNATTAAHVLALMNGADILRVHDVREAKQTIKIFSLYQSYK